jgi:hypothetical protein
MTAIDFQGGSHGNYLEFVCNKFLAKIPVAIDTPFNSLGASHGKQYLDKKEFVCDHYSVFKEPIPPGRVVSIQITTDDLLALQCISLLRAGDYDINPDQLDINTYNKLNNRDYRWVLDNLCDKYFTDQILTSYQAIADPSWPCITSIAEYSQLPESIRTECETVHGLQLYQFGAESPDCPRYILREFFKFGFAKPNEHGFIVHQHLMQYNSEHNVYVFPYSSFYQLDTFTVEISKLATWMNVLFEPNSDFVSLHNEFLKRQVYKTIKHDCDVIVDKIIHGDDFVLPKLNVVQEAYIDSRIEHLTGVSVPLNQTEWYSHSQQIRNLYERRH